MSDNTKILVVDDDAFSRNLLSAVLGVGAAYPLLMAENGNDALTIAGAERPGLVLLDVELPDIDGYDVCRQIRQTGWRSRHSGDLRLRQ